jgi:hypothetical protein
LPSLDPVKPSIAAVTESIATTSVNAAKPPSSAAFAAAAQARARARLRDGRCPLEAPHELPRPSSASFAVLIRT